MTKYVAINDTVYNFKFYRKGAEIEAGKELDDNANFARADGTKPAKTVENGTPAGNATVDKADEVAIRTRAKELKIASWHNKKIDTLLAEIAEAEAKLAAPVVEETPADGEEVAPEAEGDKSE